MFAEIGNLFLHLSLIVLFAIVLSNLYSKKSKTKIAVVLWIIVFISVTISFLALVVCYITSDFSVLNVLNNSHKLKPLIYKVAASWSNHEGSMLLWILALCFPTLLYGMFSSSDKNIKNLTLIVQAILGICFVSFTIFTSNPFERIIPSPINGLGMNPLLQDIGVSFHPPILYLGYVGFSLPFSASIAVLIVGKVGNWGRSIKPWVLFAWTFLTMGLATGAWWAYRELGWGGFWFWDPVENASLVPWITSTALMHSLLVADRSRIQTNWAILLSIITFTLVMIGTFIVRSGIVTSVHSFAQDSKRGSFILVSILFMVGVALLLYTFRYKKLLLQNLQTRFINKFLLLNNILLSIIAFIVALGIIYPLIVDIFFKENISINANYYNTIVPPLVIISVIFCILGTYCIEKEKISKFTIVLLLIILLLITYICIFVLKIYNLYAVLGVIVSVLLIIITIVTGVKMKKFDKLPVILAHCGFGLLILSISLYYGMREETQMQLSVKDSIIFRDMLIKLDDIQYRTKENYFTKTAIIKVAINHEVQPEIRFFPIEQQQTVEIDTVKKLFYDLYFSINSIHNSEAIMLNIQFNPMMNFIWIGCILMCLGGALSWITKY